MTRSLVYTDCHITAYIRYVRRIAASAVPHGPQALPFRDWFQSEYQAFPGQYVGINYLSLAASS
jgi:hypothetical protein